MAGEETCSANRNASRAKRSLSAGRGVSLRRLIRSPSAAESIAKPLLVSETPKCTAKASSSQDEAERPWEAAARMIRTTVRRGQEVSDGWCSENQGDVRTWVMGGEVDGQRHAAMR